MVPFFPVIFALEKQYQGAAERMLATFKQLKEREMEASELAR